LALLVLGGAACERLLDVETRVLVPADALDDASRASLLVRGAIADIECAYANYVAGTAMIADELISSTGQTTVESWDLRVVVPSNTGFATGGCDLYAAVTFLQYGLYTPLHTARFQADDVLERLTGWTDAQVPNRDSLRATAAAYAGYAYALFGEGFCTAAFDGGPELTPPQVLALAEQRFTTAIDLAEVAGPQAILNMALVGRARVRLDLGDLVGAAADAQLVDSGFVRNATRVTGDADLENVVFVHNRARFHVSVDPRFRGLQVDGVADPRVAVVDAGRKGVDGVTPLWYQTKYTARSSPIPIASWDEAQLIIAEAEGGQTAVDRINALRGQAGLPLFSTTDPAAIEHQILEERRRELFLEGHRLNDMLRHNLPFDTGIGPKGKPYGTTTCLPLPDAERDNNDNIP